MMDEAIIEVFKRHHPDISREMMEMASVMVLKWKYKKRYKITEIHACMMYEAYKKGFIRGFKRGYDIGIWECKKENK
jgi:hypothetical protein